MHTLPPEGFLLLEDGTLFLGRLVGSTMPTVAEVVFTTNMTGYQEVFTDPSYRGQIVVMTAPEIGNYGVNADDGESAFPQVSAIVVRELSATYSNWRATGGLPEWLATHGVPALTGVDTRRLTKHLRSAGVMRGVIAIGASPSQDALAALDACPSMAGRDLASVVSTATAYASGEANAPLHVVAYDYGIKENILRLLGEHGCRMTVVPSRTPASAVLALQPDGVFLSNGPGDPEAVTYALPAIREIAALQIPMFGICLGHQLIALSFGGRTEKMPYGHRGGNQPVKELSSGRVLITAQNHGFSVVGSDLAVDGAPELNVTHVNLNDGTVEGLRHRTLPIFAVQYHPEAAPGPHDAVPLFDQFIAAMRSGPAKVSQTLDS